VGVRALVLGDWLQADDTSKTKKIVLNFFTVEIPLRQMADWDDAKAAFLSFMSILFIFVIS
jgi:hypothetical protein